MGLKGKSNGSQDIAVDCNPLLELNQRFFRLSHLLDLRAVEPEPADVDVLDRLLLLAL